MQGLIFVVRKPAQNSVKLFVIPTQVMSESDEIYAGKT